MIHIAMTDLMTRRRTGENAISWRDATSQHQIYITDKAMEENSL